MNVRLFLIFVVIFEGYAEKRGSPCTTPNFEDASCLPLRTCKVIIEALQTPNASAREFAKQSQCGYDSEPLICCGSSGYPTLPLGILDLFTKAPEIGNKVAKPKAKAVILSNFNTNELPDRTVCGLNDNKKNKITGGTQAEMGEFPWMAALEYKSKLTNESAGIKCGGSIINKRYVLTAAHCILHPEFKLIKVWLGDWNITSDPDCNGPVNCADRIKKINISNKIPHPFYFTRSGNHDIGLLRLEHDIQYTYYIRPICLPPTNLPIPEDGTKLTVAGWGTTENSITSDVQLKVEVPILPSENCNKLLTGATVNKNQLCAGGEPGKDSCQGDSGGPLMRTYEETFDSATQWYQEGIVASGVGCGHVGSPAIYTRVSRYILWIIEHITED